MFELLAPELSLVVITNFFGNLLFYYETFKWSVDVLLNQWNGGWKLYRTYLHFILWFWFWHHVVYVVTSVSEEFDVPTSSWLMWEELGCRYPHVRMMEKAVQVKHEDLPRTGYRI
jgi:hypothetical protein